MARRRSRRRNRRDKFWIQRAIKRPGRVKAYMKRRYGKRAFTKSGEIKMSYLRRAVKETKNRSLRSALLLAIRLKRMRR
jgi:hypothetical protein